jgi:NitT/TauT family transport system substrate-binding protein
MQITMPWTGRRSLRVLASAILAIGAGTLALFPSGCSGSKPKDGPTKLTVAYLGLTCEAPIFVAYEKEFFKEEGLDVDLVKTDWDGLREGLGSGRFDANHTLVMYLLQAIEKGSDIKMTGGIHTGCLRLQASVKSDIKSVADFKGKKIGIPTHEQSPPHMFACRVLTSHDLSPSLPESKTKDVEWVVMPPGDLEKALKDDRVDGIATTDPIGTILLGKGIVRTIADQAEDAPYRDEFCCAATVSGKLARNDPKAAAAVTRALLKGAKWVHQNPTAAANLAVEKKYVSSTAEYNAQALSKLKYVPAVDQCRDSILSAAKEMKKAGLLKEDSDSEKLAERAWVDLSEHGVTDKWVKDLKVEKVANGGPAKLLEPARFAEVFGPKACCNCCCVK